MFAYMDLILKIFINKTLSKGKMLTRHRVTSRVDTLGMYKTLAKTLLQVDKYELYDTHYINISSTLISLNKTYRKWKSFPRERY